jgi:hypothetical protein
MSTGFNRLDPPFSTRNSEGDFGMGFSAVISALDRSERGTSVMARGNRHSYFIAHGPAVDGDSNRFMGRNQ